MRLARAFPWLARIGRTPKRRIAFSPMNASTKPTFWGAIFRRRTTASRQATVVSWSCTIQRSLFQRESPDRIGITYNVNSGRDKAGRIRSHTVCGILMHSSLALTTEGLPLGLAAIKFWKRKKFKGTAALKKKINPTRVPIEKKESIRWLENLRQSTATLGDPASSFSPTGKRHYERGLQAGRHAGADLYRTARKRESTRWPMTWQGRDQGRFASVTPGTEVPRYRRNPHSSIGR